MGRIRVVIVAVAVIVASFIAFYVAARLRADKPSAHEELSRSTSGQTSFGPRSKLPDMGKVDGGSEGRGLTAINRAVETNRYLFVYFYKIEDEHTRMMKDVFDAVVRKVADRVDSITINITDPSEKGIVDMLRVDRTPMPLAIVIAPNGAITGAFPRKFEEERLLQSIVSPCTEKCLKALQERKLVFLCIQNRKTRKNSEAMRGVLDFKADVRFAQVTEIIALDPDVETERAFLGKLKVGNEFAQALTVLMAPPGRVIGTFSGATDKDQLEKALLSVMSSCGSGCGPSGCAPR